MDDIRSMEVSEYLHTLTSAGLLGIESCRKFYVLTGRRTFQLERIHLFNPGEYWGLYIFTTQSVKLTSPETSGTYL